MAIKALSLHSEFSPAGDQPQAIAELVAGLRRQEHNQVLLGVTGSGKTFTMAHIIQELNRPALILAHNKTLAAQLFAEMRSVFPNNAVEYFVSYYDYYQPEAYVPRTDTFIEKEATINEDIDRLRHAATQALLERRDVVIVASVSCIYGIGSVETYGSMTQTFKAGEHYDVQEVARRLVELQYKRNDLAFERGTFRLRGDLVDIFPSQYRDRCWRLSFFGDALETIVEMDPLTGEVMTALETVKLYANSHYVTPGPTMQQAIRQIKDDLKIRLHELHEGGKLLEAQRLERRTKFDLEMMVATGTCAGIENYSRYLSGRAPGEAPPTLFDYLPSDALLFVDESHVTVPQIRGMSRGDAARKDTLVEHGFRLPSARDNRPLRFEEWEARRPHTIFVSATPGPWELEQTAGVFVEQVVRPTGLVDPPCEVRPTQHQVDDLLHEIQQTKAQGFRTLVTTLTKKMSEALTEYLTEMGVKVAYLHSDVETLERMEIIQALRRGDHDVLVGINLLREGLDIPECALVAILDADKEGFLRSRTSLIQTIGRAARNAEGRVILYADVMTDSLKQALDETARRRQKQQDHNAQHNIIPTTVRKSISYVLPTAQYQAAAEDAAPYAATKADRKALEKRCQELKQAMLKAASDLDFEEAARLRDALRAAEALLLG